MRKIIISLSVLLILGFTASQLMAKPPTNKPEGPSDACYQSDTYITDWLRLKIQPGNSLVTGIYQFWVPGAQPGPGLAYALMVGTIQDVTDTNTINGNQALTQIALNGSIHSGNFNDPKAKECGVHLVFTDDTMTEANAWVWCDYWGGSDGTLTSSDKFEDYFVQTSCSLISELP